ncbi:hypothetical protein [Candidiatus Paracoxiella cheracis]|uniref:hypothetical protein n=1 Tax=Candidiatus Paracoxiella cheracis TaxID=3405120 RepID=UPI003BF5F20E
MSVGDLRQANYLFNYCLNHIHQAVPLIQEQMKKNSEPMLDPTHPLVMNNINHPLNPSNPNNIMLNPGGNIMVQQAEAEEASVNEAQEEENAENHLHEILSTSLVMGAAAQAREELKDDFDPHKFLNVTPETEQSEIAAAAYNAMAEHMPHDEHQKPSPEFKMATLAAGLIGTHKLHEEFKLGHKHEHGLEKSAEDHGVMSIPKFTPIK